MTRRLSTIRARITTLAAVAVAVVLASAALVVVTLVRWELLANLDNSLNQRADTFETALLASPVENQTVLLNSNDQDRATQLVDTGGNVLAATPNLDGAPGFDPTPGLQTTKIPMLEDDAYRVLTRTVATASGPAVLHVAQNVDDLNDTIRNLAIALALILPVVVAILAAVVWWLVGRTLQPVESIRSEVADISGTDVQRRVAVPASADEIARLAQTMNEMLDRIDLASQRQRQFVADAAHELRTPLTRIRTELEVDISQPATVDNERTTAAVLAETIGLQELLEDLLFLARSDEHHHRSPWRPVDLDDIVLQEANSPGRVRIDTSHVSGALVVGDEAQLRRAVRNLLSNAVRHAESLVTVRLREVGPITELTISDDGPGVPPESVDRIFERFGRSDDARSRHDGGSGLGLAIVRDIVERHHGVVRFEQAQGGAVFVVELPSEKSDNEPRL